jgi:putative PIN family toxin of toxin-antitoxin system
MKIVLDTNVLVAGLLSPFGPCGEIIRMVSSGELTLCIDARILSEYSEVLHRHKFRFDKDKVAVLLGYRGQKVASSPLSKPLPDPDDEPFLEVALSSDIEHLITGNHAHFPPDLCRGVKVLSPSDFLKHYRKGWKRKKHT